MPDQPVEGRLFSRNYVRPEEKLSDSMRARRRINQIDLGLGDSARFNFVQLVQSELGLEFPFAYTAYSHEKYWTECAVRDFLDSITLLYDVSSMKTKTLSVMRRIFEEEHLRYRIDDNGAAHYLVDEQFERNAADTIEGIASPQFKAARHALEEALKSMSGTSPSGKALIRGVFESVESAFLVTIQPSKFNKLNDQSIQAHLFPTLIARYKGVPEAQDKVDRILELLKAWVKIAHPFRHGAPLDQVHEAPFDYAVLLADQGMAFLRYIVIP